MPNTHSSDSKEAYQPNHPSTLWIDCGFRDTLNTYLNQLRELDDLIFKYADLLEKAQPLFSGRVLVRFSKRPEARVMIARELFFDMIPKVGKMLKNRDGSWMFLWVEKIELKNLEKYRVSQNTPWDREVVQILKNLSVLLQRRQELMTILKSMRVQLVRTQQGNASMIKKMKDNFGKVDARVDWDFRTNAKELLEDFYSKRKILP